MTAEEILVIILSIALAIFLILAIVLTSFLIAIARKVNEIVDTAERTVAQVEGFVTNIQNATGPALISGLLADMLARMTDRRSHKKEKEED
ncbi:MAG TPA: hypothetical protein VFT87_04430 [Candidatus Saccharimonadales bacterium]|nr:hypothetical protein [Candidatus Saccharimonadales bacterium]